MSAPVPGARADTLVFAWGNPSRGDDALGPLFVDAVEALQLPGVECLTDFQLQVEHALDLVGRKRVLFVDASCDVRAALADQPFQFGPLLAHRDASFTTHAMSPASVLQVYTDLEGHAPPPTWLLAIRGEQWELGQQPSAAALDSLQQALAWATGWLGEPA
ncbi:MAG: hydrogenase maturation protease [Leptothrix sp. (in: b-proteobacteria)]